MLLENIEKLQNILLTSVKQCKNSDLIDDIRLDNAQTFDNQIVIESMLCFIGLETRFLRLILIFLLA